ncbi:MAG TPA: helix-turn-helix transcriptional regulator [Rhizomicrobium sp.]
MLQALRNREGLTQAQLAQRLDVNQTAISRWERSVDQPGMALRRRIRDMHRNFAPSRQDRALKLRVQQSWNPTALVARGAMFLEINNAGVAEANAAGKACAGQSIYGAFGQMTDETTAVWEKTGIFDGNIALAITVNRLELHDGQVNYIRTVDTPYFTSEGEVWCLCEIKRIDAAQYNTVKSQMGAATFSLPFDSL